MPYGRHGCRFLHKAIHKATQFHLIMGAEYADGDQHTWRSVLGEIEDEITSDLEQVEPAGATSEE